MIFKVAATSQYVNVRFVRALVEYHTKEIAMPKREEGFYLVGSKAPSNPTFCQPVPEKGSHFECKEPNIDSVKAPVNVPLTPLKIVHWSEVVAYHRLPILGNLIMLWATELKNFNDKQRRAEMFSLSGRLQKIIPPPSAQESEAEEGILALNARCVVDYATSTKEPKVIFCLHHLCKWIEIVLGETDCDVSTSLSTLETAIAKALRYLQREQEYKQLLKV